MDPELSGLDEVAAALARRWLLVLLVVVPLFGAVLGYAQTLPTTWTARATVAFTPRPSNPVGADTVTLVLPSYLSYVLSAGVLDDVGDRVGLDRGALESAVDVSVPPTTATLEVVVTGRRAQQVADVANALGNAAVGRSADDPVVSGALVAPAVAPTAPSGPRRQVLLLGGLLAALLAGALVTAVVERGTPRVRTAADVRGALGLEVLGRVPRARSLRALRGAALGDPAVALSVRALHRSIEADARTRPLRVLAVCSAAAGEGRSTVAAALGAALVRDGARVLLVDADLVRARLTRDLPLDPPEEDLLDALQGRPLEQVVVATTVPGLDLLPAVAHEHPELPDAGDLLVRRAGRVLDAARAARPAPVRTTALPAPAGTAADEDELLGRLATLFSAEPRATYDLVVVDTPALLERDEAAQLARLADAVLLVADTGRQTRALRQAGTLLTAAGVRPLGVVLNRTSRRSVLVGSGS